MARHLAVFVFAFAGLLGCAAGAQLVVTTTADEDDGDALPGNGAGTSLREAVKYANPADTITFAPALSGQTISVTNGLVPITRSVTIDASDLPGGVTINGHGLNSLFHGGSQTTNTLIGLTLTGGRAGIAGGGAILNDSILTINQCTFTNNAANEAGAIFNFTTLTVNNSTFVGNHARFGGAIEGDGGPDHPQPLHLHRQCF
jgi:CSLREA domain-containing protein